MKRLIVSLVVALMLVLIPAQAVFADSSQDVAVTATPSYISIANDPSTWSVGDIGAATSARIAKNTTYYTNPLGATTVPASPVVDAGCRFTITNTSSVATDLTVNFPNLTGAGDTMTNVNQIADDTATAADADSFVAWSYCTGMTTYATDKVLAKAAGSSVMKDALAATTDIKWGLEIQTQTGDWTSGTAMTSTVTITATAD